MTELWTGGAHYPRTALYYGIAGHSEGGIDNQGSFQLVLHDNPKYYFDSDIEQFRLRFSPGLFSAKALAAAKRASGLGDFESHPSIEMVEARLMEIAALRSDTDA